MSGPGVGARRQERTSKPSTPSRSPTARATASHMSKKASCKKRCTGTPSRTRSFGANISPAQKHVLGRRARRCNRQGYNDEEEGDSRHRRGCELLVSAWPQSALGLCVATSTHAAQPCRAALFERTEVEAHVLKRPRGCTRPAGVPRPDVLVQSNKGGETVLGK